ncbi:Flp pilus assembly protein CpaB [Limnohabitans sp. Rim28]|uniref:Flp pilus assembly protein CpaB n=1 Tax=Limnohabitans sp. Rim28 TaxID=1100720 RepID=UPI0002D43A95|nr:Flp pilus assembly protein CpaB [Limnohabitans sp. Rim28]
MRNIRPMGALLLALALGLAAAAYAASWLQQQASANTFQVIVAERDLTMGTRLQPDMLQTLDWPKAAAIQGPLTTLDQAVGRVIRTPLLRGEPLLHSKLAPMGEKGGLSSVLAPGQRAVTVKVNEIMGVAGFALPGNYVDVMVNTPDGENQPVSKIVIERIQVLAVAQDASTNESKPRVVNAVTLQVSPQQAEQIDLARSVGTLSLVLRSHSDDLPVLTTGARKLDLLPHAPVVVASAMPMATSTKAVAPRPRTSRPATATAPAPALSPEPIRLEVIRGLSVSQE